MRSLDKAPARSKFGLREALVEVANGSIAGRSDERRIDIAIDEDISDIQIFLDRQHFEIIVRNVLENSLRATEEKALQREEDGEEFVECVMIRLHEVGNTMVTVEIEDNGTGVPAHIVDRLYRSKCSTQAGRDHGHGGLIIARLMELNGGDVRVAETTNAGANTMTLQRMRFPLAVTRQ
jgi:signal transduction histidine kinase